MINPWMTKNPFLSLWLSGTNTAAGMARVATVAELNSMQTEAVRQTVEFWTELWMAPLGGGRPGRHRRRIF